MPTVRCKTQDIGFLCNMGHRTNICQEQNTDMKVKHRTNNSTCHKEYAVEKHTGLLCILVLWLSRRKQSILLEVNFHYVHLKQIPESSVSLVCDD